jgi:hypothetical protein
MGGSNACRASLRELAQLQAKTARVPRAVESPIYALWGRGGIDDAIRSKTVLGFDAHDMLTP